MPTSRGVNIDTMSDLYPDTIEGVRALLRECVNTELRDRVQRLEGAAQDGRWERDPYVENVWGFTVLVKPSLEVGPTRKCVFVVYLSEGDFEYDTEYFGV